MKRAVREILVIAIVIAIAGFAIYYKDARHVTDGELFGSSVIVGLMLSIPAWFAYRIVRYAISR